MMPGRLTGRSSEMKPSRTATAVIANHAGFESLPCT